MEQTRLLSTQVDEETLTTDAKLSNTQPSSGLDRRNSSFPIWIHLGLVAAYTIIAFVVVQTISSNVCKDLGQFRAIDSLDVRYRQSSTEMFAMSVFHGSPTVELDAAWDHLLESRFIKVTEAELKRNDRHSVELQPGGPFLAWLGVFHELHCMDFIRRYVHQDYYYPNMTEVEEHKIRNHVDHCMDRIQAVVMCHPDYSTITTMHWNSGPKPMVDPVKTLRTCVDWDALMESLRPRVVTSAEMEALHSPII